ncbi:MAG: lysylphosphatidylglycerol synthase transmembrane domain-containing protein [Kiritimatiellia bacterium]|jgi:hypothetical protein|nr:lysylphosphatidylglycerol synthase transmembrane domain-containing protein [Kiritimatiellia bacterium]
MTSLSSVEYPGNGGLRRHGIAVLIALSVSALTLIVVCRSYDITFSRLIDSAGMADRQSLLLVFFASALFHIVLGADKLWRVLRAMRVDITFSDALRIRLGSGPLRLFVPLKAGEAVNIVFFCRHKRMALGRAGGAVVFDRSLNIAGSVLWLLIGLVTMRQVDVPHQVLISLLLGMGYVLFFFLTPVHAFAASTAESINPKLGRFVSGLLEPLREFSAGKKAFFLLYGFLFQARDLLVCYFLFRSFGFVPDPATFIAFVSIAQFAGHLPSVVGMGPREAALVMLFSGVAPSDVLLSIGFMMTLAINVVPMLIGLPWVPWFLRGVAKKG